MINIYVMGENVREKLLSNYIKNTHCTHAPVAGLHIRILFICEEMGRKELLDVIVVAVRELRKT